MPLALDERNQWREKLRNGEIPFEIRHHLDLYRSKRDDPNWRATRVIESLGEIALVWLEEQEEKRRTDK